MFRKYIILHPADSRVLRAEPYGELIGLIFQITAVFDVL